MKYLRASIHLLMEEGWCYVKVHRQGNDVVVAICDEELLGAVIECKGLRIPISKEFYGGQRVPISQLWEYIGEATIVNAFGNRVVKALAERVKVVLDAAVELGGVLHVQLVLK